MTARPSPRRRVVVFGFDAAESSQIRRIRALMDCGHQVAAYTMRRRNMNTGFVPFWTNIHLGEVENEQLGRRVWALVAALFRIAGALGPLRQADVVVARNFDLLILAFAARLLALRPRVPLVYECLDIHAAFTAPGRKGALLRGIERFLLRRIDLLVVSSPRFLADYFAPRQGYRGKVQLMENRIWFSGPPPARRTSAANRHGGRPYVLGWVGTLRCAPSLAILLEAADLLGERVLIELHGTVHHHAVPDFGPRVAARPNVTYHGPYPYPEGLGPIYRGCDLVWAQDLWQREANSLWLLPNRIYEASYFGCLSIALAGTETGRAVAARGLGYQVEAASADALAALIEELEPAELEARRGALLARPAADFVQGGADIDGMIERAIAGRGLSGRGAGIPRSRIRTRSG